MTGKLVRCKGMFGSLTAWVLLMLFLSSHASRSVLAAYAPDPVYTGVTITNPDTGEIWLAGSKHTVSCDFEDQDCNTDTGQLETDSDYCAWSGTGSFPNGFVGKSVDYVCRDQSGTEFVGVSATDAGSKAKDDADPVYDYEEFTVIIPEIIEVNFQLASAAYCLKTHLISEDIVSSSDVAEYARDIGAADPTKNHSAVFLKNTPLSLKFKTAWTLDLTEGSNVDVSFQYIQGSPGNQEAEASGQAFEAWPYQSPSMTSTTHSFVNHICYEKKFVDRATYFWYRVPDGSNHWIPMPPTGIRHPLCVVARPPLYPEHYEWVARASCRGGHGVDSDAAQTIVDTLYYNLAENACVRKSPDWEDNWTTKLIWAGELQIQTPGVQVLLNAGGGKCDHWCAYFIALCNVQGVGPNDGLKDGPFDTIPAYTAPWKQFCVERPGINRPCDDKDEAPPAGDYAIVKSGKYSPPNYTPKDQPGTELDDFVPGVSKQWWVFHDHGIVFLNDFLYDPSFAQNEESPLPVPWLGAPGPKTFSMEYGDVFVWSYFWPTCPYLYGDTIDVFVPPYPPGVPEARSLWVETADALDEEGSTLRLHWDPNAGGRPEGKWW